MVEDTIPSNILIKKISMQDARTQNAGVIWIKEVKGEFPYGFIRYWKNTRRAVEGSKDEESWIAQSMDAQRRTHSREWIGAYVSF